MHIFRTPVRWIVAVLVALAVLPCLLCQAENASTQPQGENLIGASNPNFEQAGKDGEIPGWNAAFGTAIVAKEPISGKQALRLSNHSKVYNNTLLRVEPGYRYGIRAKCRLKNFKFIGRYYGAGLALEQLNADKNVNGNWYPMYGYLEYKEGTRPWTTAEVVHRPKETTVWLRPAFYVQSEDGSEVWVDDVYVWKEKIPDITADREINAVENGSFEVSYHRETIPNAFDVQAPPEKFEAYQNNRICVTDVRYHGAASLRMTGECTMVSTPAYVDAKEAVAKIAVKTQGDDAAAFARLRLLDTNQKLLRVVELADVKGTSDWKVFEKPLKYLAPQVRYAQWQFGVPDGAKGTVWFDDLQVNVSSPMARLPYRKVNREEATVTVDCNIRKQTFLSPLNAVDHHNIDRLYSPSIYTAGPHLEGPDRWFQERRKMGFKYIRIHHIYQNNICRLVDGKVDFSQARTNWPNGDKSFGPIYYKDAEGKDCFDFSVIHHVLDKAILIGGCKPIITLEPVPWQMALENNTHYKPSNMKLWEEMNYRFVKSLVDKYGAEEVKTWIFETGNEPGTEPEFHGRPGREHVSEDFLEMQDYTVAGVLRALSDAFIAGPSGSPNIPELLEHCANGKNAATGEKGCKLDAINYHGYLAGHGGDMSWRQIEDYILRLQQLNNRFYQSTGRRLPVFNTEFTPYFRDGQDPLDKLPAAIDNHIQAIATLHTAWFSHKHGVTLLTFFFHHPIYFHHYGVPKETMPEFLGMPTVITTHGVFKPVCRAFQILYRLEGGTEVSAEADVDPIYTLATATDDEIRVLCYNFDVNPQLKYTTKVDVHIDPDGIGKKFHVTKYELNETKANSYTLARQRKITFAQVDKDLTLVDKLNKDSELKPEPIGLHETREGKIHLQCEIPSYGAVLLVLKKAE
ncbi:MAG: hypothetical protein JXA11_16045 [Phycisphaerae bacterium]|nr:hypothetical protein [Phycisphaerae bacterium]